MMWDLLAPHAAASSPAPRPGAPRGRLWRARPGRGYRSPGCAAI